jgi:hypothetical protein
MKKFITLTERADINGEVRLPEEGAIAVPTKRANELLAAGKARAVDSKVPKKASRRKTQAKALPPAETPDAGNLSPTGGDLPVEAAQGHASE